MSGVDNETALDLHQAAAVLHFLRVAQRDPDRSLLDELVAAYIRSVPWESAFRIVRRNAVGCPALCPRWPVSFWQDARERGGGGTCFESNYAFFTLLKCLGYDGYLTINDMGSSVGCHTAIILFLQGQKWLVDVGLPLYAPLPVPADGPSQRQAFYHAYTVTPEERNRYRISRSHHPHPYCFTLVDEPVPELDYQVATQKDYSDEEGRFLDRVIVNKVLDDTPWRFNSSEALSELTYFVSGQAFKYPLEEDVPRALASHFGMDETVLRKALALVTHR